MATIEISNLYCKLKDASNKAITSVDDALAIETPNVTFNAHYQSGRWDGMTRFYSVTTGKFPTGLLSKVLEILSRVGERYTFDDKRNVIEVDMPECIQLLHKELGTITLRDYQYDSVKNGLEETRGVVNVATNGGKTEIACGIMQTILPKLKEGQRIVFFTHAKEIFTQSYKRIQERLGIKVGRIGDGHWDEQAITVAMVPTVSKYLSEKKVPKNQDPDEYKERVKRCKKFLKSIVAFIGDEVHHASSSTWYDLFMKLDNAYFRFGLTGTVDTSDRIALNRLLGCTGRIVSKVSNKFLIDNGYSAKPTIYMMAFKTKAVRGDYMSVRSDGIINNSDRNNLIVNKVLERENSGKQCLIIVNETEHGGALLYLLENKGSSVMLTHGDKSGKHRDEALSSLADGSIKVLIATTIFDEGVDLPNINCIFLAAGGKSMRQILQRIGRGLRKKADGSGVEIYDVLDYHNDYLVEHTLERFNTYKGEEFDIQKI